MQMILDCAKRNARKCSPYLLGPAHRYNPSLVTLTPVTIVLNDDGTTKLPETCIVAEIRTPEPCGITIIRHGLVIIQYSKEECIMLQHFLCEDDDTGSVYLPGPFRTGSTPTTLSTDPAQKSIVLLYTPTKPCPPVTIPWRTLKYVTKSVNWGNPAGDLLSLHCKLRARRIETVIFACRSTLSRSLIPIEKAEFIVENMIGFILDGVDLQTICPHTCKAKINDSKPIYMYSFAADARPNSNVANEFVQHDSFTLKVCVKSIGGPLELSAVVIEPNALHEYDTHVIYQLSS